MLTKTERLFLQAVAAAVRDREVSWQGGVAAGEWQELFVLAGQHKLLPMVLEAVYHCTAFHSLSQQERKLYQKQAAMQVLMQTIRTQEYGNLLEFLKKEGLHPLTVKGIVCRRLYPQPELRTSADEDMLILPQERERYHRVLLSYGMHAAHIGEKHKKDVLSEEFSYVSNHSSLRVELHTALFPIKNEPFQGWNTCFIQVWEQDQTVTAGNFNVRTMGATDHLFYLICHMLKHFLHSGFGIRQVCDLMLFAETYGEEISWEKVYQQCEQIHAFSFVRAVFLIAEEYLYLDRKKSCLPEVFMEKEADPEPLLKDILSAGIYGNADSERIHSSAMTLGAYTGSGNYERGVWREWRHLLFPSYKELKNRYAILLRFPWMLPGVWVIRFLHYRKETIRERAVPWKNAVETLQMGKERMLLLKQYGLLTENHTETGSIHFPEVTEKI